MSYIINPIGGDEGDRTPDLMNAIHALSQLSYVPVFKFLVPSFFFLVPETTKFESIENKNERQVDLFLLLRAGSWSQILHPR